MEEDKMEVYPCQPEETSQNQNVAIAHAHAHAHAQNQQLLLAQPNQQYHQAVPPIPHMPLALPQIQNAICYPGGAAAISELLQHHKNQLQQQQFTLEGQGLFFPAAPQSHNLIPIHLQGSALASSLNGSPGYPAAEIMPGQTPAMISQSLLPLDVLAMHPSNAIPSLPSIPLTVQDRPTVSPIFNGINPNYPGARILNAEPPIFAVDNFLTDAECNFLINSAQDSFGPAPVVGTGMGVISNTRTSSTCYLAREDLPDYLRKVSLLTGKPIAHCELPQVGRYFASQQYRQHFDAFDYTNEDGRRFASNGGQRVATVLVYLNDVAQGGATAFPALNLQVQPRRGMALIFFPATVDGLLDKRVLHAALPAVDTKYVSQVWIRQANYSGQPSKRLPQTLGVPFDVVSQQSLTPNDQRLTYAAS